LFSVEEYPIKQGRYSVEIIKELDKMVIDLLQVFTRNCGNRLPNRIVFYRDGVDDGQFQKVLDNEVNKVKDACRGKSDIPQRRNYLSFYL
jgi:eukaryotic translation initiation factor 2C